MAAQFFLLNLRHKSNRNVYNDYAHLLKCYISCKIYIVKINKT